MLRADVQSFALCVLALAGSVHIYLGLRMVSAAEVCFKWRPAWRDFFFKPMCLIRKLAFVLLLYHQPIMLMKVLPHRQWMVANFIANWIVLVFCSGTVFWTASFIYRKAVGHIQ